MAFPMYLKNVSVPVASVTSARKNNPTIIDTKVNVLPAGADAFLQLSSPVSVPAGHYADMQINHKRIDKDGKTFHFFELTNMSAPKPA